MARVTVRSIEGKGWFAHDMKLLRAMARQPEGHYLPCKYCKSTQCKIAPLKPGHIDTAYPWPWTRRHMPDGNFRIVLSLCEQREDADVRLERIKSAPHNLEWQTVPDYYAAEVKAEFLARCAEAGISIKTPKMRAAEKAEAEKPKVQLTATQIAGRLLQACVQKRARTAAKLCEQAGIELSEKVEQVLDFLASKGRISRVMKNKWVLS